MSSGGILSKIEIMLTKTTRTEEAALAQGGVVVDLGDLQADGQSLPRDVFLDKRAKCPSLQACVGHRCVTVVCFPLRPTAYCITYKYGKC